MFQDDIYNSFATYFATVNAVNHFAYDEQQTDNEAREMVYDRPALFIRFKDSPNENEWFRKVYFDLKLEIKTLDRNNTTLNLTDTIRGEIEAYTGTSNERIHIENIKTDHKAGNAPVHTFECCIYQRL